ncbi:Ribonuclease H-like superfamily [Sesbania bispinosa]|nr:Ribonuclease H-like superfamily [Sesbania bispinosa]
MGIDEAGRGPVLDSKILKEEKREELFEALKANDSIGWAVDVIDPRELSAKMLKKNKINLNEISHDSAMGLIDRVLKMGVLLTEVLVGIYAVITRKLLASPSSSQQFFSICNCS